MARLSYERAIGVPNSPNQQFEQHPHLLIYNKVHLSRVCPWSAEHFCLKISVFPPLQDSLLLRRYLLRQIATPLRPYRSPPPIFKVAARRWIIECVAFHTLKSWSAAMKAFVRFDSLFQAHSHFGNTSSPTYKLLQFFVSDLDVLKEAPNVAT